MRTPNQIKIAEASLRVYYFAPKGSFENNVLSERNLDFFKEVWHKCDEFGIKDSVNSLDLPSDFPPSSDFSAETAFRPLAAKINQEKKSDENISQQALMFKHADYIGLIITYEKTLNLTDTTEWKLLFDEFGDQLPKPPADNPAIDCFHLYTGILSGDSKIIDDKENADDLEKNVFEIKNFRGRRRHSITISELKLESKIAPKFSMEDAAAKEFFCALPPISMDDDKEIFFPDVLPKGWRLWEKKNENRIVSLGLLAKKEAANVSDELFAWSSFVSEKQIALFAGYLLNLSKFKYAFRIFWQIRGQLKSEKNVADKILRSLQYLNENLVKLNIDISLAEHVRLESELLTAQTKSYDLLFSLSLLREMKTTVEIARKNMESFAPLESIKSSNSFFFWNVADTDLLIEQIGVDIGYLESFQERNAEGYNLTKILQERESKKIAKRLNQLILLQGSLLGAIGVGLAALQSFGIKLPLNDSLFLPLSLFLTALALGLPTLFTHWEDGYSSGDHIIGGIITSVLFVLLKAIGDEYLPIITVPHIVFILTFIPVAILGFYVGMKLTKYLSKNNMEKQVSSLGVPLDNGKLNNWMPQFLEKIKSQENNNLLPKGSYEEINLLDDEFKKSESILKKHELLNKVHELKSCKSLINTFYKIGE